MNLDPFENLNDDDIRTSIRNANGPRPSLFVPEEAFEILVKRQIAGIEGLGLQCIDLVYDELHRIINICETTEILRFGELREGIVSVVRRLIRDRISITRTMVSNLIQLELSHINTNHPDFVGGSRAVANIMERINKENEDEQRRVKEDAMRRATAAPNTAGSRAAPQSLPPVPVQSATAGDDSSGFMSFVFGKGGKKNTDSVTAPTGGTSTLLPRVPEQVRSTPQPTEREVIEVSIIKSLISSYFSIVRKNFMDLVPKAIMYFLVNYVKRELQSELGIFFLHSK